MRYVYSAYRRRFITILQHALCAHPNLFFFQLDKGILRTQTPLFAYVSLLLSLGAILGVSLLTMKPCLGGPDFFNGEERDDGRLLAAQQPTMGQPHVAIKCCLSITSMDGPRRVTLGTAMATTSNPWRTMRAHHRASGQGWHGRAAPSDA